MTSSSPVKYTVRMAIRKQYTEQVSVVITRAMRERIEAEAEARDVSMGTVIREIVQAHYAEQGAATEWRPAPHIGPDTRTLVWSTADPAPEGTAPGTLSVHQGPVNFSPQGPLEYSPDGSIGGALREMDKRNMDQWASTQGT